jgi:hypothetical protein
MNLSVMQPYLFPYLGYFQLIKASDIFINYNDVNFIKGGWINRNRLNYNGTDKYFTLPILQSSPNKIISELFYDLTESNTNKIIHQIQSYYSKRPFFKQVFPLIENVLSCKDSRIDIFNHNSIQLICNALRIKTLLKVSSDYNFDKSLKGEDRIIFISKALSAKTYINLSGGVELYNKDNFSKHNLMLKFIKMDDVKYTQGNDTFLNHLSIIDVMMNLGIEETIKLLNSYTLT